MGKKTIKYILTPLVLVLLVQFAFGLQGRVVSEAVNPQADSTIVKVINDSLPDSLRRRPIAPVEQRDTLKSGEFLDEPINGTSRDSLVYDVRNKKAYIYGRGDIVYKDNNLKADYINVDMDTKNIEAYGTLDTLTKKMTTSEFIQGDQPYEMDTVRYNLGTGKAKIKGGYIKQGEGFLTGLDIKKMADNTVNIKKATYSTCDLPVGDQHFYINMNKAKLIPGKKVYFGTTYLVMEDVPIPFILPFGYAPLSTGRSSGWLMPEWGEEYVKGFFLRNGGYYFAFNDYVDLTVTGGFYTLGSWQTAVSSRYLKRYKYSGGFNVNFTKDIIGEKDAPDYVEGNNFRIGWTHRQDPKFRPNSNFSASVNYSSSGYNKYGATNINDRINNQTSSSIAYSKNWGGKYTFSTNMSHSQNSRDSTVYLGFPNSVFNVSNFSPFKRGKNSDKVGKEQWYEKISMRYSAEFQNSVTVKERDLFKDVMFDQMKTGIKHSIPISTSINLFKYINLSPSVNYNERWYFKRIEKEWDTANNRIVVSDTTYGFYRVYDYNTSLSASTKVYGMYEFGKNFPIQKIRHMMTPSIGLSYTPDFSTPKYGYYKQVINNQGKAVRYSPYEGSVYSYPGTGRSASLRFSLQNMVEAKIRNRSDTTGFTKRTLIDELSASSSYNFLADSLNLQPFSLSLRIPIPISKGENYSLNLSATLDPYEVNSRGQRINQFMLKNGKLGRITNTSWSFDYNFKSKSNPKNGNQKDPNNRQAINDPIAPQDFFTDPTNPDSYLDAATRRLMMTQKYYDFDVPWNFGFSYSLNYSNNGLNSSITQNVMFNGSITLTEKMGVNFGGGYDFKLKKLTPGTVNFARDLHCWQMSFSWVPVGYYKSWSFNIAVKSSLLKDLKWDKQSSFYDNLRD